MNRRHFIRLAAAAFASAGGGLFPRPLYARSPAGGYGPLLPPDEHGLMMPKGFRARVVARGGETVPGTSYRWHTAADGGACFPLGSGEEGYVYVSNSERSRGRGGVGALRFSPDGRVVDAYRICDGTSRNCAGGATPWGTWLTCEERPLGRVYECDPTGKQEAIERPALGVFQHEAVAVDPLGKQLYLTEDQKTGLLYRFTPKRWQDLSEGVLEAAFVEGDRVRWEPVPDPEARGFQTRLQMPKASRFNRGEGIVYSQGHVFFSTTGDHRIWDLDVATQTLRTLHEGAKSGSPIAQPDNLTVAANGDLVVAEDPGNLELVTLTPEGKAAPLLRVTGHPGSEVAGPAYDPSGRRLYFSSQRGGPDKAGLTFEVTLPAASDLPVLPHT